MKISKWFAQRGPEFVRKRSAVLLTRYGISPAKAKKRIEESITSLALHGCAPTFLVPGSLIKRYPEFIRRLQDIGAEIGAHSYDHVDLKAIPVAAATEQLVRAAQTFMDYGIELYGFRCPYLSFTNDLIDKLPIGLFKYSSNAAIQWDIVPSKNKNNSRIVFETINKFYQPRKANDFVCIPWANSKMVEIPVCVPDDLQLHDGLGLRSEGIAKIWNQILYKTHKRGELFSLIFHSELSEYCEQAFMALLRRAKDLQPSVWISRLRDICDWWQEKSKFRSEISQIPTGLRISFVCSSRATILAKGLDEPRLEEWDGIYFWLNALTLDVPGKPRPFVGIAPSVSKQIFSFLQDQGYILDTSETASQCSVYLDDAILAQLKNQVELIKWIDGSTGPLVRYWRWPDKAKSALSITGDLDALSLLDYFIRLFGQ